jgi:hypothetical protein
MAYGTLQMSDTLAVARNAIVAEFGEDRTFLAIQEVLAAHDRIRNEMFRDVIGETTADRMRGFGGVDTMDFIEADEFARPEAQKVTAGVQSGFPLRAFQLGIQWTSLWLRTHTVAEMAAQIDAARAADVRRLNYEIKRALFTPTNNTAYTDDRIDRAPLTIRALINADSTALPVGPNGETFNATTHTHYLGTGAFIAANLTALINTLTEHYNAG